MEGAVDLNILAKAAYEHLHDTEKPSDYMGIITEANESAYFIKHNIDAINNKSVLDALLHSLSICYLKKIDLNRVMRLNIEEI